MAVDTIVFDIETSNFFTDPEVGWDNFAALRISVVGAYSYLEDRYYCFEEHEMEKLADLFADARRIVGFSMNRYDVPVLNHYFQRLKAPAPNLWSMERVDLLDEVELATGQRISLSRLSEVNLGIKKDRHGSEAIALYRDGKMEELKEYCLKDVRLTKELYDRFRTENYLFVPNNKTGEVKKHSFPKPATTPRLV